MKKWLQAAAFLSLCPLVLLGCTSSSSTPSAVTAGAVSSLSIQSYNHSESVSDGEWIAWAGRDPMRIMMNNGSSTSELAAGQMRGKIIRDAFYDGRYVVMKASDPFVPYGTEVYYYDAQAGGAIVNISAYSDTRTDSPDISALKAASGLIVWEADNKIYVHQIATHLTEVVSSGGSVSSYPPATAGKVVAWIEDGDLYYRDYNAASPATVLAVDGNCAYPKLAGRNIVYQGYNVDDWEIYAYDIDAALATNLSQNALDDTDPAVSGNIVVWRNSSNAYGRDLSGGAVFTVSDSGLVLQIQAKDDLVGWVNSSTSQIFVADLTAGALTVASTAAQASSHYQVRDSGNFDSYYWAVGNGGVVWTQADSLSENSDPTHLIFRYDAASATATQVSDYGPSRRVKSLRQLSGGVTMWVSVGAFDRIWVQRASSGLAPVALSADGDYAHQPRIDHGLLAWSQKPGLLDSARLWEIWYCDLNQGTTAVQLTDNSWRDKAPVVDGTNRLIAWMCDDTTNASRSSDGWDVFIEKLGDGVGPRRLTDDAVDTEDKDLCLRDGLLNWTKSGGQLWYYQFTSAAGTAGVKQLPTSGNIYNCADNDGRYVAYEKYDSATSRYRYYYADLLAASPMPVAITSTEPMTNSYGYPSISDGVITFADLNSVGNSASLYAYTIGDPMDSLLKITEVSREHEYWAIHRPQISGGIIVWTQFVDEVGTMSDTGQNFEIFYYDLGAASPAPVRVTNNTYHDGHPLIGGRLLTWMAGGKDDNEGGNNVVNATLL